MELEKFIEKDIEEFLDRKADREKEMETPGVMREDEIGAYDFTRDYAEEVRTALEKGELDEARQAFMDLLGKYKNFTLGSSNKVKAYSIMQEMYEDLKEYLDEIPESEETPDTPEDLGVKLPRPPEKKQTYEEQREDQIEELKEEKSKKDRLIREINKNLERIEKLLKKHDVVAAVVLYRYVKDSFREIPRRFQKERKKVYDEIITCYYQIKKTAGTLEKSMEQIKKEADEKDESEVGVHEEEKPKGMEEEVQSVQEPVNEGPDADTDQASGGVTKEEMLTKADEVRELIQKKQAREAMKQYQELKKMFKELDESKDVKEELFKDISSLHESLKKLEKHEVGEKQRPKQEESVIKQEDEPSVLEKIKKAKMKAYKYLDNEEPRSAVKKYNEIKDLFDQIPEGKEDERERLYRDLKDLHDQILELRKKNLQRPEENQVSGGWEQEVRKIKDLVKAGDLDEAKKHFLDLQHKATKVEEDDERKEIYQALDSLKSKIHLASTSQEMDRGRAEA